MDISYLGYGIGAAIISFFLTPLVRNFAVAHTIIDHPNARKIHTKPIARLGGVAVIVSFCAIIAFVLITQPQSLRFSDVVLFGIDANLVGVLLGIVILCIVGVIDDVKGMSPWIKLAGHFGAALLVVVFGVKIWWLHNPITGIDITLGGWTYIIVPLWIVLIINVVNWLDGVDGLATGVGVIASVILFFLARDPEVNQPATALLAIILAGALVGFLPYNFNPATIFLGDVGSMFIGFILAIFAIISGGKFATAALVLGFPILDALWVVIRRIIRGQPIWHADRRHLHHRLLDAGLSQRSVVMGLWALSALFGSIALYSRTHTKFISWLVLVALMGIVGLLLVVREVKQKNV
ncbi:hypothetical protein AUK41_00865 [Candidatus Berkelbacteria bacterium CG2_30_43_20]|nr:MAG: hypothetical protein AUK41_00865 [Candidatus Berkelbacteria bacterium CG2_30_43_20]